MPDGRMSGREQDDLGAVAVAALDALQQGVLQALQPGPFDPMHADVDLAVARRNILVGGQDADHLGLHHSPEDPCHDGPGQEVFSTGEGLGADRQVSQHHRRQDDHLAGNVGLELRRWDLVWST